MSRLNLKVYKRAFRPLFFLSFNSLSLKVGERTVFEGESLSFSYNNIVLIRGRVGTGKSSLLKMLAGLLSPGAGSFRHIDEGGSALKPLYLHSQPEFNFITGYVKDELAFAGIDEKDFRPLLGKSVYDLSGGELKKLSIMMALAKKSGSVILIDEPLDMLDDIESRAAADLIINASLSRPFIIATHDHHFDGAADAVITLG